MRLASFIALALAIAGCATLGTSSEEIARTCGIGAGWHPLEAPPANSSELLSLSASGNSSNAEQDFSAGSITYHRWFAKGDGELAYCRFQGARDSCNWPNHTVQFQNVNGRWGAEHRLPTVCVSGNP